MCEAENEDPGFDRINLRISRSFLDVVDEACRERGFDSRSEFIRYALRDAVTHPEGAELWRDVAVSEAQLDAGEGLSSEEIEAKFGIGGELGAGLGVVDSRRRPVRAARAIRDHRVLYVKRVR